MPGLGARVDGRLTRLGVTRSRVVRRLVKLGNPRLREWDVRIQRHPALRRALAPAGRWLNAGGIQIPSGLAHGLWLAKDDLPLSHSQLGSLAFGTLETSVQEALLRHLGEGDVFYDIGANLGFFSILGARMVGPTGRVYSFEPAPRAAAAVRRNAELNGFGHIEVLEMGISDRSAIGRLQLAQDQSWSKLTDYGPHPLVEQVIDVDLRPVDELVESGRVAPPNVVKIDAEGAEIEALRGMERTVREHQPTLICELHLTTPPFLELMRAWGYRAVNLEGPAPVEQAGDNPHALALPPLHPGD